jgi:hypothetical protein
MAARFLLIPGKRAVIDRAFYKCSFVSFANSLKLGGEWVHNFMVLFQIHTNRTDELGAYRSDDS